MPPPRLGLRENLSQFTLLVIVNAFVGAMIGIERSILPALAEQHFHLAARSAILSFIVVFGVTKALTNYFAGRLSDHIGRKHVLVAGWIVALPVPFLLMWAPSWSWILAANALLGISQGLTWSTTVIMKIDLAGPARRGLAMGLNEFAGYFAVAGSALATGIIASSYGLTPQPFYLGVVFAIVGLLLSIFVIRETKHHVTVESALQGALSASDTPSSREVFVRTSFTDKNLSSVTQAGMVNNLNDGMAWGLFPLFFAAAHMTIGQIGVLAAIYPAVWGVAQLGTGALSDRVGRKWLIASGMWVQAVGVGAVILGTGFATFATGAALLGIGTAMVYPTLLAAIGDVAHPSWRASSVGVYRLWRDLGYAAGALLAGLTADALGLAGAMWIVAGITFLSGVVAAVRMTETLVRSRTDTSCVEPQELERQRNQGRVAVLDVRTAAEYEEAHVRDAVHLPVEAMDAASLSKDIPIVTVCGKGGGRSEKAAEQLRRRGFSARSLCGGTLGWVQWEAARREDAAS